MKIEKNDMVMVYDWRYDTAHREQTENGQKG